MSIQDVIKKSFLDGFQNSNGINGILTMVIVLVAAALFGLAICFIYNKFYRGVVYNRSFAVTLVGMCVMTSMVTLAISTNVVISLGMVGALSIVRYRTAVKEPLDLLYLFWAITTGITTGAQMYALAVIGAAVMVFILILFNGRKKGGHLYIIIIHYSGDDTSGKIMGALGKISYRVKSRTVRNDSIEEALEVNVSNQDMTFVDRIKELEGVYDVTAIAYDGEYHD